MSKMMTILAGKFVEAAVVWFNPSL